MGAAIGLMMVFASPQADAGYGKNRNASRLGPAAQTINTVLATVEGSPITQHDMNLYLRLRGGMMAYAHKMSDEQMAEEIKSMPHFSSLPLKDQGALLAQAVDNLIQARVIAKYKIKVEPKDISEQIEVRERQSGRSPGSFVKHMAKWGVSESVLRQDIARTIGWISYVRALVGPVKPSPAQIQDVQRQIDQEQNRHLCLVSEIEVRDDGKNPQQVKKKVQEVIESLEAGQEPFGQIAARLSDGPLAQQEGGMVWKDVAQVDPALRVQIQALSSTSLPALLKPVRLATASPQVFRWVFWLVLEKKSPEAAEKFSPQDLEEMVVQKLLVERGQTQIKLWRKRTPHRFYSADYGNQTKP
jgi:hypothetical protein